MVYPIHFSRDLESKQADKHSRRSHLISDTYIQELGTTTTRGGRVMSTVLTVDAVACVLDALSFFSDLKSQDVVGDRPSCSSELDVSELPGLYPPT